MPLTSSLITQRPNLAHPKQPRQNSIFFCLLEILFQLHFQNYLLPATNLSARKSLFEPALRLVDITITRFINNSFYIGFTK